METLKASFPDGVDYRIVYDPTIYVRQSIRAVVETLFEAILLVVIVVMVFLQTWRASIIPLVAVPVSLVGTFAIMLGFGFSLNTLSLFGLVLAIGIVVDDAIVVVENVERHIELGVAPIDATRKAMEEVSGPIIAIALVLCAVFVPTAFISGLTGQFYRQFALTIAISTVISAFNSLTLSPALASRLLRPHGAPKDGCSARPIAVRLVLPAVQSFFTRASAATPSACAGAARVAVALVLYVGLIGLTSRLLARAAGLRAGAGQGLPRRVRAAARRRHARSHRSGDPRDDGDRAGAAWRGQLDRLSGPVDQRVRQRVEHRDCVRGAQAGGRAAGNRARRQQHRAGAQLSASRRFRTRSSRSSRRRRCRGSGTVGGFKLYVEDRAGLGFEELYAQVQGALGAGPDGAGTGRTVLELPGERAADRRGRRSRAGEDLRRGADRRVRDAAGVLVALRERLQPVRPHLPGERAGGIGVPPAARADAPTQRRATPPARWCRSARWSRSSRATARIR